MIPDFSLQGEHYPFLTRVAIYDRACHGTMGERAMTGPVIGELVPTTAGFRLDPGGGRGKRASLPFFCLFTSRVTPP